jgi:hypothetical protein
MTRNNARIIAKYLREAGWSEVTALRQELAASKARVQEMGRHNATEAEHFRAICRRIDDWVSIMTTGHAVLSAKRTNSAEGVIPSRAELIKPSVNCADGMLPPLPTSRPALPSGEIHGSRRGVNQPRDPGG